MPKAPPQKPTKAAPVKASTPKKSVSPRGIAPPPPGAKPSRLRPTLGIKRWGPEAEYALDVVQAYMWQVLRVRETTNRAIAWAVRTVAGMLRDYSTTGVLTLPGQRDENWPPGELPLNVGYTTGRASVCVCPFTAQDGVDLGYLQDWIAEKLDVRDDAGARPVAGPTSGNQAARWATVVLADWMLAAYAGQEVLPPG